MLTVHHSNSIQQIIILQELTGETAITEANAIILLYIVESLTRSIFCRLMRLAPEAQIFV